MREFSVEPLKGALWGISRVKNKENVGVLEFENHQLEVSGVVWSFMLMVG